MLVSNQKSRNTQVKVLLSHPRRTQGIPFTFSHFTISVIQTSVEKCNICVPRRQDTSMLAIYGPLMTGESETWPLSSLRRETKVHWLFVDEVTCSHMLLPSLPLVSQRELQNTPGKAKTYHQHQNRCRHSAQPPRCSCLVPAMQWSRMATWEKVDTSLQIVRAIQVKGSPLSTDFMEKWALRLSPSSFRQNLIKLDHPADCSNKPILPSPSPSSSRYVED